MTLADADAKRAELQALPRLSWNTPVSERTRGLILVPTCSVHEDGYRIMDFVTTDNKEPLEYLAGCCSSLHFGDWNIDCLPGSGLLRLLRSNSQLPGLTVSSRLSDVWLKGAKE